MRISLKEPPSTKHQDRDRKAFESLIERPGARRGVAIERPELKP
jgi:hypothetical protein